MTTRKHRINRDLAFTMKAKAVVEAVAAELSPVCHNVGTIEFRPRHVKFVVRARLDADAVQRALARLVNRGVLVWKQALGMRVHSPDYAALRARGGIKVELWAVSHGGRSQE